MLRRFFDHLAWADDRIFDVLDRETVRASVAYPPLLREMAHVIGADDVWLSRIEGHDSSIGVWPTANLEDLRCWSMHLRRGYRRVLEDDSPSRSCQPITYTNSAGQSFTTPLDEILGQVVLHAQYHRGRVNLLLRQNGLDVAPVDFISFVRGTPAATRSS